MNRSKLQISRRLQVVINLLLIAVLIFALYIFSGCPCSLEQFFRRMEKANHIGPGEILGIEEVRGDGAPQVVLADGGDAVTLAAIGQTSDGSYRAKDLFYLKKTGDITVAVAPVNLRFDYGNKENSITIFVFDGYPQATRAQLELEVFWDDGSLPIYRNRYTLDSERETEGYFRLDLPFAHNQYKVDPQAEAIHQLSLVWCEPYGWTLPADAYPAVVRLYDSEGNEIAQKEMQLIAQKQSNPFG